MTNIPNTSVAVNFTTPSGSDNCAVASVTCLPPTGSSFGLGVTTVTCTATDPGGNTNACTFTVEVHQVLQVSGQVALEGFVGTTRNVQFSVTDGTSFTNRFTQTLSFGAGAASYSFAVPAGTTRVSAKTAWHLRQTTPGSLVFVGGATVANFTLPAGDITGTNGVDLADYYQLAAAWYQPNSAADIDGSGLVDLDDYFLMANHWLEQDMAE